MKRTSTRARATRELTTSLRRSLGYILRSASTDSSTMSSSERLHTGLFWVR